MKTFEEYNLLWLNLEFLRPQISKEHQFLYKYFSKTPHKQLMEYFYVMGEKYVHHFPDHTGYKANAPFLSKQFRKFKALMSIYNTAKENLDFEALRKLDQGKTKLKIYRR